MELHCVEDMFVVYIIVGTCCNNMQATRVDFLLNKGWN